MYAGWSSLEHVITHKPFSSALDPLRNASKFESKNEISSDVGKKVCEAIIKPLAESMGIPMSTDQPSILRTANEVKWYMEVICYGLTLPISEHDIIRDCVNIYCEWFSALSVPKSSVPKPIIHDPDYYCQTMLDHLYNMFIPRSVEEDNMSKQAMLCHRILRTIQEIVSAVDNISKNMWEKLLLFLMSINDILFTSSLYKHKDDHGNLLCERVLSVLFDIWIIASHKCFPSPTLWKTLQKYCQNWRHHNSLIVQWNRINIILTAKVIQIMYGLSYSKILLDKEDEKLIPDMMSEDAVVQTWYRMLNTIGNPIELSQPNIIQMHICKTTYPCKTESIVKPPLENLPGNFLTALKGIAFLCDIFLGINNSSKYCSKIHLFESDSTDVDLEISSSFPRKGRTSSDSAKLKGVSLRNIHQARLFQSLSLASQPPISFSDNNESVNVWPNFLNNESCFPNLSENEIINFNKFDLGKAEALGVLCRIFCSKRSKEEINIIYLAQFYCAVAQALHLSQQKNSGEVLANIILNGVDLFKLDLDGINVLIPSILLTLEIILTEAEMPSHRHSSISLRRASIQILLTLICLPQHFSTSPIHHLSFIKNQKYTVKNFSALRPHLVNLMLTAIQLETESINTQLLLGGLFVLIQDLANFEKLQTMTEKTLDVSQSNYSDSLVPLEPVIDWLQSVYHLWLQAVHVTCHRLNSSWLSDFNVSFATLELLMSLASVQLNITDAEYTQECAHAVRWICDYVAHQCSRPPQQHIKELHSAIVMAFQCLMQWVQYHPNLLQDKNCLDILLETIELGISGSKSHVHHDDICILKNDKEIKPVSIRVKDQAENLLMIIMNHAGHFPMPNGASSLSSLIDELCLLKQCCNINVDNKQQALQHFKYFAIDNSTILSMLEQSLENIQDSQPNTTLVIRGPFGRHVWTFQLRQFPKHMISIQRSNINSRQFVSSNNTGTQLIKIPKMSPDLVDRISTCEMDKSIPSLESIIAECGLQNIHDQLSNLLLHQLQFEEEVTKHLLEEKNCNVECIAPPVCQEFKAARLFLSHFGFLTPDTIKGTLLPSLIALDCKSDEFASDLDELDQIGSRIFDTVYVFYVRSGQNTVQDILGNILYPEKLSHEFHSFFYSLGWPIDVRQHPGSLNTAWKIFDSLSHFIPNISYSGDKFLLYWADILSELVFLAPTLYTQSKVFCSDEFNFEKGNNNKESEKYNALFHDELKMLVVWLENAEDCIKFPAKSILDYVNSQMKSRSPQNNEICILFLYLLENGLLRIMLLSKQNLIIPLLDGMIIRQQIAGLLVRQTVLNICRRKRLDSERSEVGYLAPQSVRKAKIQDILKKYQIPMNDSQFKSFLFENL